MPPNGFDMVYNVYPWYSLSILSADDYTIPSPTIVEVSSQRQRLPAISVPVGPDHR